MKEEPAGLDLLVVECAECLDTVSITEMGGRIHGRPYCKQCLIIPSAGVSGLAGGMSKTHYQQTMGQAIQTGVFWDGN